MLKPGLYTNKEPITIFKKHWGAPNRHLVKSFTAEVGTILALSTPVKMIYHHREVWVYPLPNLVSEFFILAEEALERDLIPDNLETVYT